MELQKLIDQNFEHRTPTTLSMVTLTPPVIDLLLSRNVNNIPPVKGKIRLYAELMRAGDWKYNGDSLRVSARGVLLDGQNRLMAAKEAKFNLVSDIVVGLPDDVFNTIDQGRVRQRSHLLARSLGNTASQSESNTISKAVSKIMKHDQGYSQMTGESRAARSKLLITPDLIYDYVENHPDILDEVKYVKDTFGSRSLLPQSTILYLYHIGSRFDKEYTEIYLNKLLKSTGLKDGETLHHLNQALIRVKSKTVKWSRADIENTLIKVWNSVARSGMYSIKHYNNVKARSDETHISFNAPSYESLDEMKGL
ncbi:conserved hypothetical protein [Vibrio jasicida]|uniref:ParB/Sulfiredoxin domain-containing protein n=1 Tax=Vibrio jasicida TaxID=766224 RepID=A0AAU9QYE0_9VIBR|nr:conserved hypothetical protein [Vibrio jasicida]CAH1603871.1 conserved hypothetical protein [Vibrio jasicida]